MVLTAANDTRKAISIIILYTFIPCCRSSILLTDAANKADSIPYIIIPIISISMHMAYPFTSSPVRTSKGITLLPSGEAPFPMTVSVIFFDRTAAPLIMSTCPTVATSIAMILPNINAIGLTVVIRYSTILLAFSSTTLFATREADITIII